MNTIKASIVFQGRFPSLLVREGETRHTPISLLPSDKVYVWRLGRHAVAVEIRGGLSSYILRYGPPTNPARTPSGGRVSSVEEAAEDGIAPRVIKRL